MKSTGFTFPRRFFAAVILLLSGAASLHAATIVVTTTAPGVNADGQCSLQEAIYSANYDDNVAPDPAHPGQFLVTGCNKGSGDDIIQLPQRALFQMSGPTEDPYNYVGRTATPLIFTNIEIQANGSTFVGKANGSAFVAKPNQNFRLFAIGTATVNLNAIDPGRTVSGTGSLFLSHAYISGFQTKGGDGGSGGGGGLGAGGAIYLHKGQLTIVTSTFAGNYVFGGNGAQGYYSGGGGGGLGGNGGGSNEGPGGGGGGAVGDGAATATASNPNTTDSDGGGGGGTARPADGTTGGFRCGGNGGPYGDDGASATCPGGGGGGGGTAKLFESAGEGRVGAYGGGGGGGGNKGSTAVGSNGGNGGFGGGGGSTGGQGDITTTDAGSGGFGAGGGACYGDGDHVGASGRFAGPAGKFKGGGGAGLGGAIFNDSGTLVVRNSTFAINSAYGGAGDTSGDGQGNAVFSRNGTTTLTHITVSDSSDPNGHDIVDVAIVGDGATAKLNLANSLLANNKAGAPNAQVFTFNGGSVSQSNSGNLIETSPATGGVNGDVTSVNPRLKPLAYNPPGDTPTMAIPDTTSSAYATADPAKRLPADQRGIPRKTHPDIGAFEFNDIPQSGPNFVVTTADDPGHGFCGIAACSLRHAINNADVQSFAHTITFDPVVRGTITLDPTQGPIAVTRSMTITGPGARLLGVSGGSACGVFKFTAGSSLLSDLTIRDGLVTAAAGSGNAAVGGGIFNQATLTVQTCTFVGNRAAGAANTVTAAASGGAGAGGAIANYGVLTVDRCTFNSNGVTGGQGGPGSTAIGGNVHGGPGGGALGGAIFSDTSTQLSLNNCTFSGNTALGGTGGHGQFGGNGGFAVGGVFNHGTMVITACTLKANGGTGGLAGTGNSQFNGGSPGRGVGGIADGGGASTLRNTLIAANTGSNGGSPDVNGAFTSSGYNLIRIADGATGAAGTGDQIGTGANPRDAKIGTLANNGGPTDTIAPLAGSPAIDKGKSFGLTVDQRGLGRPLDNPAIAPASGGDNSDIGALEVH